MSVKRTGLSTLAYMGVEATTPPQLVMHPRTPTTSDYSEFQVGTIWVYEKTYPLVPDVWMLVSKRRQIATWLQLNGGGGAGTITQILGANNINILNGLGPIVTVNLNTSILQPATNATGTEGLYSLAGNDFMHAYGTQNTFIGTSAGNRTLTPASATQNTAVGAAALSSLTTGDLNTAIGVSTLGSLTIGTRNTAQGYASLSNLTTGSRNTAIGDTTLTQLTIGQYNTVLGQYAGYNYTTNEHSNILIGNQGTIADTNTIRIGTQGAGLGQQDLCYIAGIYGATTGGTRGVVEIDSFGKLGTHTALNGELLIGATGGPAVWAPLTSSDGTVTITRGINSIDLKSAGGGGGGVTTFATDVNSPAVADVALITFNGDGIIETDGGSGSHIVTISLTNGAAGQLLIGGGVAPVWASLTSGGGSITITPGANSINLEAVGGGGGANTFITDSGNAVSIGGVIDILGGLNINTSAATNIVTINLDNSIALPSGRY